MAESWEDFARKLQNIIVQVRSRRQSLEEEWLNGHAAWRGVQLRSYYNGDAKHYIPVARRTIERVVTRMTELLVPGSQFFEVYPGDVYDLEMGRSADAVRAYMDYLFTYRLNTYRLVSQICRCLLLYSRAITKTTIETLDLTEPLPGLPPSAAPKRVEVWPTLRVVDPFSFYVFPETVTDLKDAILIFEDGMLTLPEYEELVKLDIGFMPVSPSSLATPTWPNHVQQRLSLTSISEPSDVNRGDREPDQPRVPDVGAKFLSISEAWVKSGAQWIQCWVCWNITDGPKILYKKVSVYPELPYRMALARPLPGELYTSGMMQDIEPLQVLLNDQTNMGEDSREMAAFPPVMIDPSGNPRAETLVYGPRRKWIADPESVGYIEIPDTSVNARAAAQATLGLITQFFAPSGLVEGQPPRNSPRAGFAVNTLLQMSMADVKALAQIAERELLSPALSDMYRLSVLFVPDEQVIKIPGAAEYKPMRLTVSDLYGGWIFRWVGTLQAQDMQMRGQRVMSFLPLLMQAYPILQQQGWMINAGPLIKMIWRDVLGERGVEQIVVPMPPEMRQQLQMQQMQAQQGGSRPSLPGTPEAQQRQVSRQLSRQSGVNT